MAHRLPPTGSALRDLFEVEDLVEIGTRQRSAPTFWEAADAAARMMREDSAIRAVHSICLRASGALVLERFGPRGGHRTLWTFAPA